MAELQDLQIEYRHPGELNPYAENARQHTPEQVAAIRDSIARFGFNNPILLKDDRRTIGAGHGRQLAAMIEPVIERVPTIVLQGLTELEWRAYVIADNRLAEQATWDFDTLRRELAQLRLGEAALANLAGFTGAELDALLNLGAPPSLDDLAGLHGEPAESDFWPVVKVQVPPAVRKRYDALLTKARGAGKDEHLRFKAILDAVDPDKLKGGA